MLTITHKAVDEGGFTAWVKTASPGQTCIYHDGDLANDRLHEDGKSLQGIKAMKIDMLALAVHKTSNDGLVHLVQRRVGTSHYEYIAIRTSKLSEQKSPSPQPAIAA